MDIKFSIIIPVYNEESRIIPLINSLIGFCDDIIVINKSSTDRTKKLITMTFKENVRVVDFPYTEKGIDDFKAYSTHSKYEWIFVCVASEVIRNNFWEVFSVNVTEDKMSTFTVIMIPRLYYCFGFNVENSPWDVSYFPFFFNKNKVVFSDKLHEHFTVIDESERHYMHCNRSDMIQHLTHQTVECFLNSTLNYAKIEMNECKNQNFNVYVKQWMKLIREGGDLLKGYSGPEAIMHYAAWNIYWSTNILFLCESARELNSNELYQKIRERQDISKLELFLVGKKQNFFKRTLFESLFFRAKKILKLMMIRYCWLRKFVFQLRG